MLGFVKNFIPYRGLPIGVDLGEHTIRLAQVEQVNDEYRLVHAEEVAVQPAGENGRSAEIVTALKSALRNGSFRGRSVAIGLSAAQVQIKHLRIPRTSAEDFANTLSEHATNALNAPSSDFLLRGVVAGEIFGEQSPQHEVVLFATPQTVIHQLLEDAAAAKVQIVGVHVQQRIAADYYSRLYRRKADESAVNLFVDLGATGTRAFVAAPSELRFVRSMPLNVTQIHERIARAAGTGINETMALRKSVIAQQTANPVNIPSSEPTISAPQQKLIDETSASATRLADELEMCRRYYESTFPNAPVTRLIFIGGGARDRLLCSAVAQAMSLPAQIGDPLVRFNRTSLPSIACIDRREAMPQWSAAFGLSMCGQTIAHV